MKVTVRLFATLKDLLPKDRKKVLVELAEGSTVNDVAEHFKIPQEETLIIKVNGRSADKSTVLKDGDRVGIFPPVGGG
ncbi:MoaD/ThiS family protein [Fuchsiella alkaliacetigena]|uniref:MoaD/ThiS family protein n=1 Tax=Fuchsiella alkaliacetigena TaxID=957042 RepID=UPI00200B639E|nr:MoaD/ThiS family protein [Fuchsiella alkaliacetigena]MCK8824799.1 MoaD/ThiS family protein [Fuchsiella alkaliacetigena]